MPERKERPWTPGPWIASQVAMGFSDLRDAKGRLVFAVAHPGTVKNDPPMSDEEKYANLAICAAAPELFEALEELHRETVEVAERYNIAHEGSNLLEAIVEARSALNKALGKRTRRSSSTSRRTDRGAKAK